MKKDRKTAKVEFRLDLETLTKLQFMAGRNTSEYIRLLIEAEYQKLIENKN
jgi:hypothetical protein